MLAHKDKRFSRLAILIVATALMLWPALVNKGPFWFFDSSSYIRVADAAVVYVTGYQSGWSDRLEVARGQDVADSAAKDAAKVEPTRPVLLGRSIYYGFLIFLPILAFGPWGAIVLQAFISVALIAFCLSLMNARREHGAGLLAVVLCFLALATPLPFYVCLLMPDVVAGLLILIMVTLLVTWKRSSKWQKLVLLASAAVMVTFHITILLMAIIIGAVGVLVSSTRWDMLQKAGSFLGVVSIGILANLAFSLAIEQALKKPAISPPFLSARMTAAGPGMGFLKASCAADSQSWELCSHLENLPQESDHFLWSRLPSRGVFQLADEEGQRRMAGQDKAFFIEVLLHDPIGVIGVSAVATLQQLVSFEFSIFNYARKHVDQIHDRYPPDAASVISQSRAAHGEMPTTVTLWAVVVVSVLSLVLLLAFALRDLNWRTERMQFAGFVVMALFANAAMCGALSGPHGRYQMRIIWLLPVSVLIAAPIYGPLLGRAGSHDELRARA